jgi:hypothetical protein
MIRSRLGVVNTKFKTLDADIRGNVPTPGQTATPQQQNFLNAWTAFSADWQKFFADNQSTFATLFPFGTGTGTVNRQIDDYESQMAAFQTTLRGLVPPSAQLVTATITSSDPLLGNVQADTGISWFKILFGTAILGLAAWGGYAAYLAFQEARMKKKILEEEIVPRVLASRRLPALPAAERTRLAREHDPYRHIERAFTRRRPMKNAPLPSYADLRGGDDGYDDGHDEIEEEETETIERTERPRVLRGAELGRRPR